MVGCANELRIIKRRYSFDFEMRIFDSVVKMISNIFRIYHNFIVNFLDHNSWIEVDAFAIVGYIVSNALILVLDPFGNIIQIDCCIFIQALDCLGDILRILLSFFHDLLFPIL